METKELQTSLFRPSRLWTREEALSQPSPVPATVGAYAFYFRQLPPGIPDTGCLRANDASLLYLGISPRGPASGGSLRDRIDTHYQGDASWSTLRRSLGVLLSKELGIELRRVRQDGRLHFAAGEDVLSQWMDENALVVWYEIAEPWNFESSLIRSVPLPLNIQGGTHPFARVLKRLRKEAAARARELPVLN